MAAFASSLLRSFHVRLSWHHVGGGDAIGHFQRWETYSQEAKFSSLFWPSGQGEGGLGLLVSFHTAVPVEKVDSPLTVCPRGSTNWASCGGEGGFLEHVRVTAGVFGRILGRGGARLPRRPQAL